MREMPEPSAQKVLDLARADLFSHALVLHDNVVSDPLGPTQAGVHRYPGTLRHVGGHYAGRDANADSSAEDDEPFAYLMNDSAQDIRHVTWSCSFVVLAFVAFLVNVALFSAISPRAFFDGKMADCADDGLAYHCSAFAPLVLCRLKGCRNREQSE